MIRKLFGSRKRKVVSATVTAVLVASAGIAAWQVVATSTNAGKAGVATLGAPTISAPTVASPNDLVPNSAAFTGSVAFKVTNPNTATLYLKSIGAMDLTNDPVYTVTGGLLPANCTKAILKTHLSAQAVSLATGISINGSGTNGGVSEVTVPGVIKADDTTPNDCQGAVLASLPIPTATFSTAP